jgi:hypothetical protein
MAKVHKMYSLVFQEKAPWKKIWLFKPGSTFEELITQLQCLNILYMFSGRYSVRKKEA